MVYLRSFMYCFFIVFFVNYLIPGVDVVSLTKLPYFKTDVIFPLSLAFLNFGIPTAFRLFGKPLGRIKLGMILFLVNIAAYTLLKVSSLGVYITTIEGYFISIALVTVGCLVVDFIVFRSSPPKGSTDEHSNDMFGDF